MIREISKQAFPVQNNVRAMIFLLLFVLAFLVNFWLVPLPWCLISCAGLMILLPLIHRKETWHQAVHDQIFDRIRLKKFGVEYGAGWFGDSWIRPYNEFRVEFTERRLLGWSLYQVKLKHRVLPNLLLASCRSVEQSEQLVARLIQESPLKLLKSDSD